MVKPKFGKGSNQWVKKPPSPKPVITENKINKLPKINVNKESNSLMPVRIRESIDNFRRDPNCKTASALNHHYRDRCEEVLKDFIL